MRDRWIGIRNYKSGGGPIKKQCEICGEWFTLKHPNQKYCSPKCRILARKRQINKDVRNHRRRYRKTKKEALNEAIENASKENGEVVMKQYHTGKGTGSLGPTPNEDFDEELLLIQKEMRRLKIDT